VRIRKLVLNIQIQTARLVQQDQYFIITPVRKLGIDPALLSLAVVLPKFKMILPLAVVLFLIVNFINNFKMKNSIFLILILLLYSCSKTENAIPSKYVDATLYSMLTTDSITVNNYVLISSNQIANTLDSNFAISACAAFTDSITHKLVNVNSLMVNSTSVPRNSTDSTYYFSYSGSYLNTGLALAGRNAQVKIQGVSSSDTLSSSIYVPKNLVKLTSDFPDNRLSIYDPLVLKWIPDSNTAWANVVIQVSYYSTLSRWSDPSLPANIKTLTYTVPDNGNYTIPASALQRFPAKSYIGISLGRGSQVEGVLPISKKRIVFFGIASANTPPIYRTND
jgi:hypothetical protein